MAVEAPAVTEIALIDLSSIAYPVFLMSGSQPDPDYTSQQIVARVRQLTATHPKAAICCDKGKSFRHELAPEYKAQREAAPAALHHQIALAVEQLQADGYPVWAIKGFEADDLIATAATVALGLADTTVLIMSADKDLLQLVSHRVRVMSVTNGTIYDPAGVLAKFGVWPEQMRDYLVLVGDASDNVKGAAGIGPKKAAELLHKYETLEGVYDALTNHGTQFKPAMATSLREFQPRLDAVRALITLRTDAEIPFAELDNERRVAPMEEPMETAALDAARDKPTITEDVSAGSSITNKNREAMALAEASQAADQHKPQALVVREPEVLAAVPVEFERQLEPRSLPQAMQLANHMHAAKMFNGYGSPQGVLSTILAGRELGLQAVASLRGFHVIEGKHSPSADLMRALVLKSGTAKYFRCVERTAERATFETWRKDEPEPVRLTFTIEEGWAAFKPLEPEAERKKKWAASGWGKYPANMVTARAGAMLARLVYPDLLFGLYTPEELTEGQAA